MIISSAFRVSEINMKTLTKQMNELFADERRNTVHRGCTKYRTGHNADCKSVR